MLHQGNHHSLELTKCLRAQTVAPNLRALRVQTAAIGSDWRRRDYPYHLPQILYGVDGPEVPACQFIVLDSE